MAESTHILLRDVNSGARTTNFRLVIVEPGDDGSPRIRYAGQRGVLDLPIELDQAIRTVHDLVMRYLTQVDVLCRQGSTGRVQKLIVGAIRTLRFFKHFG